MANQPQHPRFGNIRRRESGRYQIRYPGPDGRMRTGPETYGRKPDAERALSLIEGQIAPKLEPVAMQARRDRKGDDLTDAEPVPTAESGPDLAEQIEKLADLKAKGMLTDEEFAGKKAELLARM